MTVHFPLGRVMRSIFTCRFKRSSGSNYGDTVRNPGFQKRWKTVEEHKRKIYYTTSQKSTSIVLLILYTDTVEPGLGLQDPSKIK